MLRQAGHDVVSVSEVASGSEDSQVLAEALGQGWILFTSDKDFGELLFLRGHDSAGVVLLRIEEMSAAERVAYMAGLLPELSVRAEGHFVVASARRVRYRPLHRRQTPGSDVG